MTRDKKAFVLSQACPLWLMLDEQTRDDLIDGKCIYMQHECVPIVDYTRKHPFFYEEVAE